METTKRHDDEYLDEIPHTTKQNVSDKHATSDVVFDDGLQIQPPDGLTKFGEYYFRSMSMITDGGDIMDWPINALDEYKRNALREMTVTFKGMYPVEFMEIVRMIGSAVLDGGTERAIMMTENLELIEEEIAELNAKIYMAADRWDEALDGLLKVHYREYDLSGLFEFMTDIAYRMNKTVELDKLCKEWDRHGYDRINLHINRARVMCRKGFLDDGLNMADAILTLEPTNAMAHLLRGNILATRGMHKDAIGEFKEGLKHDEDPLISIGLAKSLYAVGQKQQAQELRDNLLDMGINPKMLASVQ